MLYEIHMLKNYPSTNLNRDDTGTPKTCVFGGVTRGRISSQCLKRSWRTSELLKDLVGEENLGIRTRKLPEMVADVLRERGIDEKVIANWIPVVTGIANKEGKINGDGRKTAQIVIYAPQDVQAVADVIEGCIADGKIKVPDVEPDADTEKQKNIAKKQAEAAKKLQTKVEGAKIRPITLDIALFGRMVTSDAFRDVEAAMQVAHAVSTNRVVMESDYYTAMDDLLGGESMEDNGAGMIGDIDYNSACYYQYASIDADALRENLRFDENAEELVRQTIPALIQTMAMSNPTGKQNSFAGHVLPSAILVECKERKVPVSYVNAYTSPAKTSAKKDLVQDSIEKLIEECNMISRNYALPVEKRLWFCVDKYPVEAPENAVCCQNFRELVDAAAETLK